MYVRTMNTSHQLSYKCWAHSANYNYRTQKLKIRDWLCQNDITSMSASFKCWRSALATLNYDTKQTDIYIHTRWLNLHNRWWIAVQLMPQTFKHSRFEELIYTQLHRKWEKGKHIYYPHSQIEKGHSQDFSWGFLNG